MDDHRADGRGHRNLLDARVVDAHREHEPAEQRGRNVVDVHRAARDRLAVHGEFAATRSASAALPAARWPPPPRRRPRQPTPRGRWRAECPCPAPARNPNSRAQRLVHRDQRAPGGVTGSLARQIRHHAADGRDASPLVLPRVAPARTIADGVDREAEDVETDGDIADRGWRKRRARPCARPEPRRRGSQPRPQIGGQAQQIGKHAAGGHGRSGTRSLHDQRIVAVARGRKAHHIVRQRDVGEGMPRGQAR